MFDIKQIEPKCLFSYIDTGKTLPKNQPPLNILNLFIITEQTVLVQSLYVVQRILLSSLYTLAPTLYLRAYCHHMYTVSYSDYTTKRRS